MDAGRSSQIFVIDDFPGFYSGISKSKLPPGALVDWGVGKGQDRTLSVECSNQGELLSARGMSRLAKLDGFALGEVNSCFFWEAPIGGAHFLVGYQDGIAAMYTDNLLGPPPGFVHQYFELAFMPLDFSSYSSAWQIPEMAHLRQGKFVPYGDRLYYCDGVGYPLRLRGIGYPMEAMGVGGDVGSTDFISLQNAPYRGGSKLAINRQYWVTLVSRFGESPAFVVSGDFSSSSSAQAAWPLLELDWTAVSRHVYGVNVYRPAYGDSIPRFAAYVPRGLAAYLDSKSDEELGYPISLDLGGPSVFRLMEVFEDRMFAVGGFGEPNRVACSQVGQPDVWPPLNTLQFTKIGRNDVITDLRSISGNLYIFTKMGIFRLRGSDPTNYVFDVVSRKIGCVSMPSMCPWEDGVVFLSMDGIYFFNGARLTRMSDALAGLFQRQTSGLLGWDKATGAVSGDQYHLSYYESDETAYFQGGSYNTNIAPNRVLIVNLRNGRVGVRNELPFFISCPLRGVDSIVGCKDYSVAATQFFVLSDHPMMDTSVAQGQITNREVDLFLADVSMGNPDQVKILDRIEIEYECMIEASFTATVYRSAPLGETVTGESSSDTSVFPSGLAQYGSTTAWTGTFGLIHLRRAFHSFTVSQGKSFNIGLRIDAYGHELRVHRMTISYHIEKAEWLGSSVAEGVS